VAVLSSEGTSAIKEHQVRTPQCTVADRDSLLGITVLDPLLTVNVSHLQYMCEVLPINYLINENSAMFGIPRDFLLFVAYMV